MTQNGLSPRFPGAVAHGIHSITLEDIRYYFKPNATEKNNVPTLNYDLEDKLTVLKNAKLYGYDTSFRTVGMHHLDQVLRDMDKKNWYLTNYSTLERLVHTIHMNEVWSKTKIHYDSISLLKYNTDLCACIKDIKNNGVLKILPFMALKIRYPGITSGEVLKLNGGGAIDWSYNVYFYYFFNEWSKDLRNINFNDDIEEIKRKAMDNLIDGDRGIQHLDSEKAWAKWKSGMKKMVERDNYELAMFLYCILNEKR